MEILAQSPASPVPVQSSAAERAKRKATAQSAIRLIPAFLEAARWGFSDRANELAKGLAEELQVDFPAIALRILKNCSSGQLKPMPVIPSQLLTQATPRFTFPDIVLTRPAELQCQSIISEHNRGDELKQVGLYPRHKVLFHGESGTGKTMLAEAMANELQVPFFRAKYGNIIESFLGGTGKNLTSVFEYVKNAPCVLFFDEFDGVALDRNRTGDVGELRRVTNQLLLLIDDLPPSCVFIAATNTNEQVDRAVRRRFDFCIEFKSPSQELRLRCANQSLSQGVDLTAHAERVASFQFKSLSGLVKLCEKIRRDHVLNNGANIEELLRNGPEADETIQPAA